MPSQGRSTADLGLLTPRDIIGTTSSTLMMTDWLDPIFLFLPSKRSRVTTRWEQLVLTESAHQSPCYTRNWYYLLASGSQLSMMCIELLSFDCLIFNLTITRRSLLPAGYQRRRTMTASVTSSNGTVGWAPPASGPLPSPCLRASGGLRRTCVARCPPEKAWTASPALGTLTPRLRQRQRPAAWRGPHHLPHYPQGDREWGRRRFTIRRLIIQLQRFIRNSGNPAFRTWASATLSMNMIMKDTM